MKPTNKVAVRLHTLSFWDGQSTS